jgi:hypothetical protein
LIEYCYAEILIIVLDLYNKNEERNKRRRDKEADGRHSSKKQFRRKDVPDYEHCLWNHWEGSGPHNEEAWLEKVGLPEDSFAALVLVVLPFWIATPIIEAEGNVNLSVRYLDRLWTITTPRHCCIGPPLVHHLQAS